MCVYVNTKCVYIPSKATKGHRIPEAEDIGGSEFFDMGAEN